MATHLQAPIGVICDTLATLSTDDQIRALKGVHIALGLHPAEIEDRLAGTRVRIVARHNQDLLGFGVVREVDRTGHGFTLLIEVITCRGPRSTVCGVGEGGLLQLSLYDESTEAIVDRTGETIR